MVRGVQKSIISPQASSLGATRPVPSENHEILYHYLTVSNEAVSATLIREAEDGQKPIYFTNKALQGPEVRYQQIKKGAFTLIIAARRLRYYFLAQTIVVRTDQPIKQLLGRPN